MIDKEKETIIGNMDTMMAFSRLMYLSAVKVGFSETQAMAIVVSHVNSILGISKKEVNDDSDSDA